MHLKICFLCFIQYFKCPSLRSVLGTSIYLVKLPATKVCNVVSECFEVESRLNEH